MSTKWTGTPYSINRLHPVILNGKIVRRNLDLGIYLTFIFVLSIVFDLPFRNLERSRPWAKFCVFSSNGWGVAQKIFPGRPFNGRIKSLWSLMRPFSALIHGKTTKRKQNNNWTRLSLGMPYTGSGESARNSEGKNQKKLANPDGGGGKVFKS